MKLRLAFSIVLLVGSLSATEKTEKAVRRCERAAGLLTEIMATPDQAIPRHLLSRAQCIGLIPGVKKVGLLVGGRYGKGVLSCRSNDGWSGPSKVRLEGGSFGLQIGGSSTDIVLLVMNEEGVDKLTASKFTLGADAAVAAGPLGRSAQAQTDAQMHAKILSYSRSRGLFAGLSLEGATLRPDADANRQIYGRDVSHREILSGEIPAPATVSGLLDALAQYPSEKTETELASNTAESGSTGSEIADASPRDRIALPRKQGLLTITSQPSVAEIQLNGHFNGMTPRSKVVDPGEYEITLEKAGFETRVETVTVRPGERVTVDTELTPTKTAARF